MNKKFRILIVEKTTIKVPSVSMCISESFSSEKGSQAKGLHQTMSFLVQVGAETRMQFFSSGTNFFDLNCIHSFCLWWTYLFPYTLGCDGSLVRPPDRSMRSTFRECVY